MKLNQISTTLLNEASAPTQMREALDSFAQLCSDVTGVVPDRSFDAWAGDSLLEAGVAIAPEAAAHCVKDYQRSVVFISAVHAAINTARERFANQPIEILYAGCGPFATLLLPLLGQFKAGDLHVHLLDIHQRSLDSVAQLIEHFGLQAHRINYVQDDACRYQHSGSPHIIITETMQKSLEQEPQFAVTANLAPQLHPQGIFIPQKIEVELCLADLEAETAAFKHGAALEPDTLIKTGRRHPLGTVLCLTPETATALLEKAKKNSCTGVLELNPVQVTIPTGEDPTGFDALLFTRIQVFEQYRLLDYESEITLPLRCTEMRPLQAGEKYQVWFELGSYPRFHVNRISKT
jgi:hypothetical protein